MKTINKIAVLIACLGSMNLSNVAEAQVVESSANGFLIQSSHELELGSQEAYAAFVDGFSNWYDASHSYSGQAENLSLDLEKHCMLERLADGGFVRHMEIVFHQPGSVLRMTGGLGPLQGMGVSGAMTFTFSETAEASKVEMAYSVSGADHLKLDKIAGPVDQVLKIQLDRFQTYCRSLKNDKDQAAWHMDQVLQRDSELSEVRNHACEASTLSQAIKDYVAELKGFDFEGCPEEFAHAFNKHQLAWSALIPLTDKHSELRGEMHDLLAKIEASDDAQELAPLKKAIFDTWSEIEEATKTD